MLFSGDDDRKDNDGESVASVGEEYEPISDDELDEILADSQKKEDQQDEEKITGTETIRFYAGIMEMLYILIWRSYGDVLLYVHVYSLIFPRFINH